MITVAIAGGSGYAGGELLRLLLAHPDAEVRQITSERLAGKYAHRAHPNLRGLTRLRFSSLGELSRCGVLFSCLPHGESACRIDDFRAIAERIVDLGADFRLDDPADYERFYRRPHPRPDLLGRFVYGIAELNRDALRTADLVACAGCNATVSILALRPLYRAGLADSAVIEVKVGSSEAGNRATEASHHPERSGAMRSYKPTGHRHLAEIQAVLGGRIHFSATSVEMVRGILATCHVFVDRNPGLDDRDLWMIYRSAYACEPFVRIVNRSAFRDEGIRVENNMPFSDGERVFIFNGELHGVRNRARGRIGAEKVFNFVKRFDRGDFRIALERGLAAIEARTRHLRAINLIVADTSRRVHLATNFREDPGLLSDALGGAVRHSRDLLGPLSGPSRPGACVERRSRTAP